MFINDKRRTKQDCSLRCLLLAFATALPLLAGFAHAKADEPLTLYSYRQESLIEPIIAEFTKQTGIKVATLFAADGLIERILLEGAHTPADVLLTSDFGKMLDAQQAGIAAKVKDAQLEALIPAQARDVDGQWFALTKRVRLFYTSKAVFPNGVALRYEDLGAPDFKYRVCMREGTHPYNIGLIASMINANGLENTRTWLKGLKTHLGQKPQGNDRAQVKAVWSGFCDIALGNSYYYGKMLEDSEQKEWAEAVNLTFPNQQDRGAHVNVSGAVLLENSDQKEQALALLRYLASDQAQQAYAELNYEYPIRDDIARSQLVKSWGEVKFDAADLNAINALRKQASQLVEELAFDH